ncbi:MAG: hypothetical protein RQ745_02275 [Longimicrobiales bacterium]|nr:hypothetical protein [Longimicrobiales bacterium]
MTPPSFAALAAILLLFALPSELVAQAAPQVSELEQIEAEWNSPLALSLVERAREARAASRSDPGLTNYRSNAEGFVYFYIDRPEIGARTLMRTDQLALEVLWQAPGFTRQRIVGRRNEERLPTSIRYHLDHLTIVQDEFEDIIRIGDGDEVSDVTHPVAPGAEAVYDFRVTDSLTLAWATTREVRVYELQVRPKRPDRPGFVGTLYLDAAGAAIVRMAFSFTPSSYVDPFLDYIRISLDNALWLEEHWLPWRQETEVRREVPEFDFLSGSVIRSRFSVGDYEFNSPLPEGDLMGAGIVTADSPEQLGAYVFEDGLYSDVEAVGLAPAEDLADVETQIREIGMTGALSGLAPARFHLGGVSDLIRYNRAEGVAVGAGTTLRLPDALGTDTRVRVVGGWANAAERVWLRTSARFTLSASDRLELLGRWNELGDIGPIAGASRLVNTFAALDDEDYFDPWRERSIELRWTHAIGGPPFEGSPPTLVVAGGFTQEVTEKMRVSSGGFRPVRPIDDGEWGWGEVALRTGSPMEGVASRASVRASAGEGRAWIEPRLHLGWRTPSLSGRWRHHLSFDAGWVSKDAPAQAHYLLGGRGTLPGYDFRSAGGDAFVLARARVGREVWAPWVSAHALVAFGWIDDVGETSLRPDWELDPTLDAARVSAGFGADLLWEVLRLDLARPVSNEGDWVLLFSVNPDFWSWL